MPKNGGGSADSGSSDKIRSAVAAMRRAMLLLVFDRCAQEEKIAVKTAFSVVWASIGSRAVLFAAWLCFSMEQGLLCFYSKKDQKGI